MPRPVLDPRRARGALVWVLFAIVLVTLAGYGLSGAGTPPRVANPHGSFKEDCGLCHGAEAWTPVHVSRRFDHAKFGFALTGAHAATECRTCHTSLDFAQAKTACASCHEDPHRGEMGTDCARCHGARSFIETGTMLRAHQLTRFPLTGSHAALECEACHPAAAQGQMRFVGTEAECQSCHMTDYRSAKNPDHVAGDFSRECQTCHTTFSWSHARFDHDLTGFPLTGAHRGAACQSCHGGGVFAGTSPNCASCHQRDYDGTTDPNHALVGFSLDCQDCHTTTGWPGAVYQEHDANFFPIYSGTHKGRWSGCATCHVNSANQADFSCFSCHPHDDKAGTDSRHASVSGYSYDSQSCYSCHPQGRH